MVADKKKNNNKKNLSKSAQDSENCFIMMMSRLINICMLLNAAETLLVNKLGDNSVVTSPCFWCVEIYPTLLHRCLQRHKAVNSCLSYACDRCSPKITVTIFTTTTSHGILNCWQDGIRKKKTFQKNDPQLKLKNNKTKKKTCSNCWRHECTAIKIPREHYCMGGVC